MKLLGRKKWTVVHHGWKVSLMIVNLWLTTVTANKTNVAVIRDTRGDVFYSPEGDPKWCSSDWCSKSVGVADTAYTEISASGSCYCRCVNHSPIFREDLQFCVNTIRECSTMATFSTSVTGSGVHIIQIIPYVLLPLTGQLIYPNAEIKFPGRNSPVCHISRIRFMSQSGWMTMNGTTSAATGVKFVSPFKLFQDEKRIFLQWTGNTELRLGLEGRLLMMELMCTESHAESFFTPCIAFRVAGTPGFGDIVIAAQNHSVSESEDSQNKILSRNDYIFIGGGSLLLGLMYLTTVLLYMFVKRNKIRNAGGKYRTPKDDDYWQSLQRGGHTAVSGGLLKSNPLLRRYPEVLEDVEGGQQHGTEQQQDRATPSNKRIPAKRLAPTPPPTLSQHQMEATQRMQHFREDEGSFRQSGSSLTDEKSASRSGHNSDVINESMYDSFQQAVAKKKLFFDPIYFEPDLLMKPPPAAVEFLSKIRELISHTKWKTSLNKYEPSLTEIPEENSVASENENKTEQQTVGDNAAGKINNDVEKWLENVPWEKCGQKGVGVSELWKEYKKQEENENETAVDINGCTDENDQNKDAREYDTPNSEIITLPNENIDVRVVTQSNKDDNSLIKKTSFEKNYLSNSQETDDNAQNSLGIIKNDLMNAVIQEFNTSKQSISLSDQLESKSKDYDKMKFGNAGKSRDYDKVKFGNTGKSKDYDKVKFGNTGKCKDYDKVKFGNSNEENVCKIRKKDYEGVLFKKIVEKEGDLAKNENIAQCRVKDYDVVVFSKNNQKNEGESAKCEKNNHQEKDYDGITFADENRKKGTDAENRGIKKNKDYEGVRFGQANNNSDKRSNIILYDSTKSKKIYDKISFSNNDKKGHENKVSNDKNYDSLLFGFKNRKKKDYDVVTFGNVLKTSADFGESSDAGDSNADSKVRKLSFSECDNSNALRCELFNAKSRDYNISAEKTTKNEPKLSKKKDYSFVDIWNRRKSSQPDSRQSTKTDYDNVVTPTNERSTEDKSIDPKDLENRIKNIYKKSKRNNRQKEEDDHLYEAVGKSQTTTKEPYSLISEVYVNDSYHSDDSNSSDDTLVNKDRSSKTYEDALAQLTIQVEDCLPDYSSEDLYNFDADTLERRKGVKSGRSIYSFIDSLERPRHERPSLRASESFASRSSNDSPNDNLIKTSPLKRTGSLYDCGDRFKPPSAVQTTAPYSLSTYESHLCGKTKQPSAARHHKRQQLQLIPPPPLPDDSNPPLPPRVIKPPIPPKSNADKQHRSLIEYGAKEMLKNNRNINKDNKNKTQTWNDMIRKPGDSGYLSSDSNNSDDSGTLAYSNASDTDTIDTASESGVESVPATGFHFCAKNHLGPTSLPIMAAR